MGTRILIGLLLICCFNVAAQEEWKLQRDRNNIKVYTRIREGTNLKEFRAVTVANASLDKVSKLLEDINNSWKWQQNIDSSALIKRISPNQHYAYYLIGFPWPMDDRDALNHSTKVWSSDRKTLTYYNKSIPDLIPEIEGIIRIHITSGSWKLEMLNDKQVRITYESWGDPGGKIPTWLINSFLVDGSYKTLISLKEQVE